jgi:hypothetical protein
MTDAPNNRAALVQAAAAARVAPARVLLERLRATRDGQTLPWPISMGVVAGPSLGDDVTAFLGDHLSPGIMLEDLDEAPMNPGPAHLLACVGNLVRTRAGRLLGVVYGKRGGHAPGLIGPQHICVLPTTSHLMEPEDEVVVQTSGRGLALDGIPQVALLNMSPWLLDLLPITVAGGQMTIAVTGEVASRQMGAGIGQDGWVGDVEIADPEGWSRQFGELVAIADFEGQGRYPRTGYTTIGIVSHGPSWEPGHGVGLTVLLTGPSDSISLVAGREQFGSVLATAMRRLDAAN